MLKAYPTFSEYEQNEFQCGFVEALRRVERIAQETESRNSTDNQTAGMINDFIQSSIHRYEPGHDKPANGF